jgi:hypothetical protein
MNDSVGFPVGFYIALALLGVAGAYAWKVRETGVGIPMGAVLATVGVWYFGDALYNPYEIYVLTIGPQYLEEAWWQVALFILAFFIFVQIVHRAMNRKLLGERSQFMDLMNHGGIENPEFQKRIDVAAQLVFSVWIGLMVIALINTNFDLAGIFAPYISGKSNPWSRGRIGGNLDAFISFFNYLHIMLAAAFGIILAVSKNPRTRSLALVVCALTLPWFFLGRTRNTMLAVALPGLLAWVFVRLKGGMLLKVGILAGAFLITEGWMRFIIETRSGADISQVVRDIGIGGVVETVERSEAKHAGLNMLEELAWINSFLDKGTYQINMGQRYFAELVNPIPRGLWQDKPMIGIDYAIARGQGWADQKDLEAGVGATISTGMIG